MGSFPQRRGPKALNADTVFPIAKQDPESKQQLSGVEVAHCHEQEIEHPTLDQILMNPKNTLIRINIRHRGPTRSRTAQISIIWTTHDVPGETKLCDLFKLHYLKGGIQPHNGVFLQQIARDFEHMSGTGKYWWAELAQEKVMDLNWVFEDNEVWLSCLVDET